MHQLSAARAAGCKPRARTRESERRKRMKLTMSRPDITAAERAAVQEVLLQPTLSLGPRLELFERKLGAYIRAPHAVGVSSGTAGLHLAMIAAGVGPGDLVLTT